MEYLGQSLVKKESIFPVVSTVGAERGEQILVGWDGPGDQKHATGRRRQLPLQGETLILILLGKSTTD